jgi:NAD(P)-dependent dehydrogenase (short-subunit alcohol dehydrogenase family)
MLTWFVTGAGRGLGLELARQVLRRGDAVVATARRPMAVQDALGASERLLVQRLDVLDGGQVGAAVAAAAARFGGIDVLVNNAGQGVRGTIEETPDDEVRAIFETNTFGAIAVTRAVLPLMRARRRGRILTISSMSGQVASPDWGLYSATKFALEAISEALHAEVAPLGIDVVIVEPGGFRTDFLDASSLRVIRTNCPDYKSLHARSAQWTDRSNHAQPGDPAKAVAAMIEVATCAQPPLRLALGADAVAAIEAKLLRTARELDQWRALSVDTGYREPEPPRVDFGP